MPPTHDESVRAHEMQQGCAGCTLRTLCLASSCSGEDLNAFDRIVIARRIVPAYGFLYRANEPFRSLYVVRAGSFKTFAHDRHGGTRVFNFYFPGEMIGAAGLAVHHHLCNAQALERSSVCILPYGSLLELAISASPLLRDLIRNISADISRERRHMVAMSKQQAHERLAVFLAGFSRRNARRRQDSSLLQFTMSRKDIANYLGLVHETVSRALNRLEEAGIIEFNYRAVHILRPDLLEQLADPARFEWE